MERVLEPELMDDAEQARAYAEADFEAPNQAFVEHFAALTAGRRVAGLALDLGCGPADISARLALAYPGLEVHAVDGSAAMLACARERLGLDPALAGRVRLVHERLPAAALPAERYDVVVSNSLLHHLPDPSVLWSTVTRHARPGAPVLVMDLMRARSPAHAEALVDEHAAGEPEILRQDFFNSLLAAFEPGEVEAQLAEAGLDCLAVRAVSDRHLLVAGYAPGR